MLGEKGVLRQRRCSPLLPSVWYWLSEERGTSCVWHVVDGESGAHPRELGLCLRLCGAVCVWLASCPGCGFHSRPGVSWCSAWRSVAGPSLGGVGVGPAASEAPQVLGWAVMEAFGINEFCGVEFFHQHLF